MGPISSAVAFMTLMEWLNDDTCRMEMSSKETQLPVLSSFISVCIINFFIADLNCLTVGLLLCPPWETVYYSKLTLSDPD